MYNFLVVAFTVTGFVSIYSFASLVGIATGITSSALGLTICVITGGIKKYKSIIKKKKKKHDKIALLAKSKLNSIEVLTSEALIDSVNSHDEFDLMNDVLKEYNKIKNKSKIERLYRPSDLPTRHFIKDFGLFTKQCYRIIVWSVEKLQKLKIQKLQGQKTEE